MSTILPYDRSTPLPVHMFSSEDANLMPRLEGNQTQQATGPDRAGATTDSPSYRPYNEAQAYVSQTM